jgi:hypothetical protein
MRSTGPSPWAYATRRADSDQARIVLVNAAELVIERSGPVASGLRRRFEISTRE